MKRWLKGHTSFYLGCFYSYLFHDLSIHLVVSMQCVETSQEVHADLLRGMMWEDFAPGKLEREVNGRLLKREIKSLDPIEPIFEVKLQCFIGDRLLIELNHIIRKRNSSKISLNFLRSLDNYLFN